MAMRSGRAFGGDITNTAAASGKLRSQEQKKSLVQTPNKKVISTRQSPSTAETDAEPAAPSSPPCSARAAATQATPRTPRVTPQARTPASGGRRRPASGETPGTTTTAPTPRARTLSAADARTPQRAKTASASEASQTPRLSARTPQRSSAATETPRGLRSNSTRSATSPRVPSPAPSGADAKRGSAAEANELEAERKKNDDLREKIRQKSALIAQKQKEAKAQQSTGEKHDKLHDEASSGHTGHVAEFSRRLEEDGALLEKRSTDLDSTSARSRSMEASCEAKEMSSKEHDAKLEELNEAMVALGEKEKEKVRRADAVRDACQKEEAKLSEQRTMLGECVVHNRKVNNAYMSLKGNIRVFCRLRPQLGSELRGEPLKVELQGDDQLTVQSALQRNVTGERERSSAWPFTFDQVFAQDSTQASIFEEIALLVQSALDGYRVAIFAYGQTGSGKTYTMEGAQGENQSKEDAGIIPRTVDLIFSEMNMMKQRGWTFRVHVTMIEVYNEGVYDLLASKSNSSGAATPRDREGTSSRDRSIPRDRDRSVTRERSVPREREGASNKDACTHEAFSDQYRHVRVESAAAVHHFLNRAARERHVAATACNDRSSRSHAVFQLALSGHCESAADGVKEVEGLLSLVDLAGSERIEKSKAEGERLREAQHINRSLSALGDVIEALGRRGPNGSGHIPYRNSKLTMLLKESLGGESKALMFVNVSMCAEHLGETLSSLRFASKVHSCNVGVAKRTAG